MLNEKLVKEVIQVIEDDVARGQSLSDVLATLALRQEARAGYMKDIIDYLNGDEAMYRMLKATYAPEETSSDAPRPLELEAVKTVIEAIDTSKHFMMAIAMLRFDGNCNIQRVLDYIANDKARYLTLKDDYYRECEWCAEEALLS